MATTSPVYSGTSKRDFHVALRAEVIDLIGLDLLEHAAQRGPVGQIAVMQREIGAADMRVMIEVIDTVGVEEAGAAHQPVNLVAFAEEQFGQIRPVLTGHTGD